MALEALANGPSTSELVELLEHQDHIMDSLQEELEICKNQLNVFKRAERDRVRNLVERHFCLILKNETDNASAELIADAEKKVNTALSAVEALQAHNANLEAELLRLRQKLDEDRPIATVNQLRSKIKELEIQQERDEAINEGIRRQLEETELRSEALQHNIDAGLKAKESIITSLQAKIDQLTKDAVETRFKLDEFQADREHSSVHLSGEMEIVLAREAQLSSILTQTTKELGSLRAERATMSSRLSALTQENASLRLKSVRRNINEPFADDATEEQMQKLLADQSHLISALREESKLLTERLEQERRDFKRSLKKLKHDKRDLEERVQKLTLS